MALPPESDDAFLREVDEELRREQLSTLWQRYGKLVIAAVLLLLAAFGAFLFWRDHQAKEAGKRGEQMAAAIEDLRTGKPDDASAKLTKLAAEDADGYRAAALMARASVLAGKDDSKGAAAAYSAIAADTALPQPYRDLAMLRQTMAEFDTLPPAKVVERLKPLVIEGHPWFGTAGEMTALAYLAMNRRDEAGRLLAAVARDKLAPASLRSRAERLASNLGANVGGPSAAQKD